MSLIRFEGTTDRGPSGTLWNSLVDWVRGTLLIQNGTVDCDDYWPYNAGNITLSADSGSAATVNAVPFGVVSFTATAGTFAGAGYVRNEYIDLTGIRQVCTEARLSRTPGATGTEATFIGFSDQLAGAVFDSSGGLDGGSGEDTLGLLWNNDSTVDLVSVINSATTVILIEEVATNITSAALTFHKFGLRIKKETSTLYTIFASVNGVVKKVTVTSTQITQAAMRPALVTVVSATDAPVVDVDWHVTLDSTPG